MSRNNDKATKRTAVNKAQALVLRIKGLAYRDIAAEMGVDVATAYRYVKDAMVETRQVVQDKADELREIEVERLDRMLAKLDPFIEAGDPKSIDTALRVSKRRSELLGLDTPVVQKQEITHYEPLVVEVYQEGQE